MSGDARYEERSPLLNGAERASGENREDQTLKQDDDEVPLAGEKSMKQLLTIMTAVWLSIFFAALDTTIIATLTTPISSEFESLSLLSWLATSYLIANAATQPLFGKLTDIFTRRWGLLFSNFFFCAGCLMCGFAQSEWVIILGRVVSGIGGGGLPAIATFVTSDLIPLRQRGLWQGYGNIVYGVGMAMGGVYGGLLNDTIGWRWAFLLQIPFMIVSGILVYLFRRHTGQAIRY